MSMFEAAGHRFAVALVLGPRLDLVAAFRCIQEAK